MGCVVAVVIGPVAVVIAGFLTIAMAFLLRRSTRRVRVIVGIVGLFMIAGGGVPLMDLGTGFSQLTQVR